MTTKHLFRLAYSAARRAQRMNDRDSDDGRYYYSPLRMALDATIGHSAPGGGRVPVPYRIAKIAAQIAKNSLQFASKSSIL
jgi:hypothetical protein